MNHNSKPVLEGHSLVLIYKLKLVYQDSLFCFTISRLICTMLTVDKDLLLNRWNSCFLETFHILLSVSKAAKKRSLVMQLRWQVCNYWIYWITAFKGTTGLSGTFHRNRFWDRLFVSLRLMPVMSSLSVVSLPFHCFRIHLTYRINFCFSFQDCIFIKGFSGLLDQSFLVTSFPKDLVILITHRLSFPF